LDKVEGAVAVTPEEVRDHFTRADGTYAFARWGRPVAPVVFGVQDTTLATLKGAIEAVMTLAGHKMAETDPELGANLMMFFCRDWAELAEVPNLDRLIPDLSELVTRLTAAQANQYRAFRFDDAGAIQACFILLRMDDALAAQPAETLALSQAVQAALLWSEAAFATRSPLAVLPGGGATVLRPEIAALIRAGYDPAMPVVASDPGHALRLFARMEAST